MKPFLIAASMLLPGALFAAGRATAPSAQLHPSTVEDLNTAMRGEAFAHAKYLLYARQARASGHPDVARMFEEAANTERLEHFSEEAKLGGLVGDDASNLQDAIRGESYEVDHMYADFAQRAAKVGDQAAAKQFEEIRNDERRHRDAFQAELDKLSGRGLSGGQ